MPSLDTPLGCWEDKVVGVKLSLGTDKEALDPGEVLTRDLAQASWV